MERWSATTVALLLIWFVAFSISHHASAQGAGWITLFDGKDLDNRNQIGDSNWKIADSVAVADKGNGVLGTKNPYTVFQLRAFFGADKDPNSAFFIPPPAPAKVPANPPKKINTGDGRPTPAY